MWSDRDFRSLSMEAKILWVFILTHPDMTPMGAMEFSINGTADKLRTVTETVSNGLQELLDKRFVEYDSEALCLTVPNWFKHNPPYNPNMVTACYTGAEEVPECEIKDAQLQRLTEFTEGLGNGSGNGSSNGYRNGMRNQKQKQKQKQKQEGEEEQEKISHPLFLEKNEPGKSEHPVPGPQALLVYDYLQNQSGWRQAVDWHQGREWCQRLVEHFPDEKHGPDFVLQSVKKMVQWYANKGVPVPDQQSLRMKIWQWIETQGPTSNGKQTMKEKYDAAIERYASKQREP